MKFVVVFLKYYIFCEINILACLLENYQNHKGKQAKEQEDKEKMSESNSNNDENPRKSMSENPVIQEESTWQRSNRRTIKVVARLT